ncbi:RNA 3'-terminal phosphate cyclase [Pseudoxanthomonas gei]|uniref:RNA 3'-terminal phosphate cyclase n=1 Tax=Pseudoxanthomonas gei TaxID=1383030 RepID=A0ABX0ADE7_9GAMM|nr:RNA 3'-terminal phosphate cyclase [Pseudoxanthomonas gei]NDK38190.1 RNA 3'-terminal phosphate cyclase [Pseudoxanthomonas gei]
MELLQLDGSQGGGQLLRSALTLSLCTGTGFLMEGIRAGRPRPGLMRQHLTAVQAACAISGGEIQGATLGSTTLRFVPGPVTAGEYTFVIGTAGSTMLVLQTLLPAFWQARGATRLRLEGGTHNPLAPNADFIAETYLPALRRIGVCASVELESHGFYPAGGGAVTASVEPCTKLEQTVFASRGSLVSIRATALMSALSASIGRRELFVLGKRLDLSEEDLELRSVRPATGPGNAVLVRVEHEDHVELFTGYGERGVAAEKVAERVATAVRHYLDSQACVSEHLADQLLLPMALAGGGEFTTCTASDHLTSNAALIEKFLPVEISWKSDGEAWRVRVDL